MRATTSAVHFASRGRQATTDAAREISALTHGDPAAWEGTAMFHELVRVALEGGDPLAAIPSALAEVRPDHRDRYGRPAPGLAPGPGHRVQRCRLALLRLRGLAVRTATSYEDAVRAAVDLGGDTDTDTAVAGCLAGVIKGFDAIPIRWTGPLHVPLPGAGDRVLHLPDLIHLAQRPADPQPDRGREATPCPSDVAGRRKPGSPSKSAG